MVLITDQLAYESVGSIKELERRFHSEIFLIKNIRSITNILKFWVDCYRLAKVENVFILGIGQPEVNLITAIFLLLKKGQVILYLPELYDDRFFSRHLFKFLAIFKLTIIFPSPIRKKIFSAKYFRPSSFFYVENDSYHLSPSKKNVRSGIVYTGILYESRPLDKVLEFARRNYPNVKIDLYGRGDPSYIMRLCKLYGCSYKGSYDMVGEVEIVANYEFGIISYPMNSLNNSFCAPNKLLSYELAGCRIICDSPNNLRLALKARGILV